MNFTLLQFTLFGLIFLYSCSQEDEFFIREFENGNSQLNAKNYTSALNTYRKLIKTADTKQEKGKLYRNIAITFIYLEQKDSAIYYSELGMKNSEKNSYEYAINSAEYHLLTGNILAARKDLSIATELNPKSSVAYNNLSLIFSGTYDEVFTNYKKALKFALKAYKIENNDINTEQLASVYFQLENFSEAKALFLKLSEKHPEIMLYKFYLGQCFYFDGNEEKGIILMQEAAERDDECKKMFEDLTS